MIFSFTSCLAENELIPKLTKNTASVCFHFHSRHSLSPVADVDGQANVLSTGMTSSLTSGSINFDIVTIFFLSQSFISIQLQSEL
jgi:hypothetical protein